MRSPFQMDQYTPVGRDTTATKGARPRSYLGTLRLSLTFQQGLTDLLCHLLCHRGPLPLPQLTQTSIFPSFTLSHTDIQLHWQVYILSLVLTTWKQNKNELWTDDHVWEQNSLSSQCFFWKRSKLRKCVGTRLAMESIPSPRLLGQLARKLRPSWVQQPMGSLDPQKPEGKPPLPYYTETLQVHLNKKVPRVVWNILYLNNIFKSLP